MEAGIEEPKVADVPAFAPTLQGSNIDWMYRTQPEQKSCRSRINGGCSWARGKVSNVYFEEKIKFCVPEINFTSF